MSEINREAAVIQTPKKHLQSIDFLRGLAALMVVFTHIRHSTPGGIREHPFFIPGLLFDYGVLGVPLFIFISGFCIHFRYSLNKLKTGSYNLNWRQYWYRRFERIYPPYFFSILLALLLAYLIGKKNDEYEMNITNFSLDSILHLTMLHNLTKEFNFGLYNPVYWSLGLETQLYVLYIAFIYLTIRYGIYTCLWLSFGIFIISKLTIRHLNEVAIIPGIMHWGDVSQTPLISWFLWCLGAYVAEIYHGHYKLSRNYTRLKYLLLLRGLSFFTFQVFLNFLKNIKAVKNSSYYFILSDEKYLTLISTFNHICLFIFIFLLFNKLIERENEGHTYQGIWKQICNVGQMSYSLYLVHLPVLWVCEYWIDRDTSPVNWAIRYSYQIPVSLLAAYIFYRVVEKRFI